MDFLAYAIAGLLVGFLVGLTGGGGGALMTPLLVLLFGFKPTVAVGTDLVSPPRPSASVSGCMAARARWIGRWCRLALGSIPSALLCLYLLHLMASEAAASHLILASLGITLVFTGIAMFLRNRLHRIGQKHRTNAPHRFKQWQPHLTVLAGCVLGILVTLTSIGAGALGAVMLSYLYPYRLSAPKVVGTDLAHAIPLTAVAGSGHLLMGHIDYQLLGWLLAGSIPGVYVGSKLTAMVDERYIRYAIAGMLVVVGVRSAM